MREQLTALVECWRADGDAHLPNPDGSAHLEGRRDGYRECADDLAAILAEGDGEAERLRAALRDARGLLLSHAPHPLCSRPEKCILFGYCKAEIACND